MSKPRQTRNRVRLLFVLSGCAIALGAVLFRSHLESKQGEVLDRFIMEDRPTRNNRIQSGDAENGKQLFAKECSSCHGTEGRGDGPAARDLPVEFHNWSEGLALNRLSDDELFRVIRKGGRNTRRSRLMPSWGAIFDDLQTWDLVAFLRTLQPDLKSLVPEADSFNITRAVLPTALVRKVTRETQLPAPKRERRIWLAVAHQNGSKSPIAYAGNFHVRIEKEIDTKLRISIDNDGRILKLNTQHRISSLYGSPVQGDNYLKRFKNLVRDEFPPAADRLERNLRKQVLRAFLTLTAAVSRNHNEEESAREISRKPPKTPGGELYRSNCAPCHGVTGNRKGPGIVGLHFMISDLNEFDRSDTFLTEIIKYGGRYHNRSDVMPAFDSFNETEVLDLITFVKSLQEE